MLTNKQTKYLRTEAIKLSSFFQVGKEGVSKNQINMIDDALEANELIKFNVLKTCVAPIREIALDIAGGTKSEIVQIIGRTIVLFRTSKKNIFQLPKDLK